MRPGIWLLLATKLAVLRGSSALKQTPEVLMIKTQETVTLQCKDRESLTTSRFYWLKRSETLSKDSHQEMLVMADVQKNSSVYGERVEKTRVSVTFAKGRSTLSLKHLKLEDSGIYFCMTIRSPQYTYGGGTMLSVVDVLPTIAQPTQKTTPKKKVCKKPKPVPQKGLPCGSITFGLLLTGVLLLLFLLGVAIHQYCHRRRARLRFIKQFYK